MSKWQPVRTMPETGKFLVLFQTGEIELWDKPENPEDDPYRYNHFIKSKLLLGWMPLPPPVKPCACSHKDPGIIYIGEVCQFCGRTDPNWGLKEWSEFLFFWWCTVSVLLSVPFVLWFLFS